jgi:glutathione S-transferase
MKLYYSPGVCSLSPHIVLREAGLSFDLVKVDYETKQLPGGADYRRLNPLGYVPLLQLDDGRLLQEGPAIVQYLADLKPDSHLAPAAGSFERVRLQEWLGFINSELHTRYSSLFDKTWPTALHDAVRAKLSLRLDKVAAQLDGRPWLLGDTFTVADPYLFTVLEWSKYTGIDLTRWPVLKAYVDRVRQRPAVKATLRAEGLLL